MIPGLFETLTQFWGTIRNKPTASPLKHPVQIRIRDIISRSPGILVQALTAELGGNRSTVRYHLTRMQAAGHIRLVRFHQRTRLYLSNMSLSDQEALAILQRGRTWDLARQVFMNPGQPQCDLTVNLQMTRRILRKYVNRLLQKGLIEEREDPPYLTYFPTQSLQSMVKAWHPDEVGEASPLTQAPLLLVEEPKGPA